MAKLEDPLQDFDVPPVLLDRGGDTDRPTIAESRPFAVLVDDDAARVRLAFAHEHLEQPADHQVVDLRHTSFELDAQVVDDLSALVVAQVEVELVGGVRLRLDAEPDRPDFVLDRSSLASIEVASAKQ